MEQSDADRAAVAREVLTELEQHFRDDPLQGLGATAATVVKWFRDEHYPAPPAPETVTVDGVTYERRDDICQGGWYAFGTTIWPDEWKGVALTRIASDARVLKERDARIAELERQLSASQKAYYDVADAVAASSKGPDDLARIARETRYERDSLRTERDAALRALEELKSRENSACAFSVDEELAKASQGEGLAEKGTVNSEDAKAQVVWEPTRPASPAPIPLGAAVEVEGVEWTRTESGWDGGARWYHDGSTAARALTALYRARHPVATRETVERVASVIDDTHHGIGAVLRYRLARAALTAAGFTLEEIKGEAGATVAASEPLASESPAATSPSPDPIPLGATIEVDGVKWARTELGWSGGAWRYRDSSTVARVLTALYRARHPVATRETVERVAKAIDDADSDSLCPVWDVMTVHQKSVLCDMARAALTAAGFTLEAGA